jgi:RNA polymerase sigma-70 factor, ECF subfamily
VNSVCNHVVSESRRKEHRHEALPVSGGAQTDAGLLDSLITEEQAREVRWVLAELPERDRRLLSAAFMDEGGRDSLCADLDVNRDYLRVLLHRAKQSFRARLAQRRAAEGSGPRAGAGAGRH